MDFDLLNEVIKVEPPEENETSPKNCLPTEEKRHFCPYKDCFQSFYRPNRLQYHIEKHHIGELQKVHKCEEDGCEKQYGTAFHLKRHVKIIHEKCSQSVNCPMDDCGEAFSNHSNMRRHFVRKHVNSCLYCSEKFVNKDEYKKHIQLHEEEINKNAKMTTVFACTICFKEFDQMHTFERHTKTHYQARQCSKCDYQTYRPNLLKEHEATHLPKKERQRLVCGIHGCQKLFFQRRNLKAHINNFHGSKERFKCSIKGCNKSFIRRDNLKRHLDMHIRKAETDTKKTESVSTEECSSVNNADAFLRKDLEQSGVDEKDAVHSFESQFQTQYQAKQCKHCDFKTYRVNLLREHEATHLPKKARQKFFCGINGCKRVYFQKRNLNAHINVTHMNKDKLECTVEWCKKTFARKESLKRHLSAHTKIGVDELKVSPTESDEDDLSKYDVDVDFLQSDDADSQMSITEESVSLEYRPLTKMKFCNLVKGKDGILRVVNIRDGPPDENIATAALSNNLVLIEPSNAPSETPIESVPQNAFSVLEGNEMNSFEDNIEEKLSPIFEFCGVKQEFVDEGTSSVDNNFPEETKANIFISDALE